MELIRNGLEFTLKHGDHVILECTKEKPLVYIGIGWETVDMYRGNFKIEDYVTAVSYTHLTLPTKLEV